MNIGTILVGLAFIGLAAFVLIGIRRGWIKWAPHSRNMAAAGSR